MKRSIFTSILLSFIMLLLFSTFIIARNIPNPPMFFTSTVWALFMVFITFMIYRTGKISKYRAMFFITYAFSFILVFITHLLEERGTMALTQEVIAAKDVPLCPVAIPMLILPAAIKHVLIFPTKLIGGPYGGFYPIMFLWLVSVFALGKGWCSWGCFYGGIDEGFSKLLRKPKIQGNKMDTRLRYLPFSVLVVVVIWAFFVMEPVYCTWLCPLKMVTEYIEITDLITYLQAIIFITLGMGLLVILPILMKKRTQCSLFCPLGAFQCIAGLINPYRIKIAREKCINCGNCKTLCPTFSITAETIKTKKVSITCVRCGKCMEACPQGAIDYSLLGVPFSAEGRVFSKKLLGNSPSLPRRMVVMPIRFFEEILDARTLFVFSGILFGGIMSGTFVPQAMVRLFKLFTTGSLLIK
ncbi:MAG: 4Fe-4S binding protein [Elusimicrobiota bacterium]